MLTLSEPRRAWAWEKVTLVDLHVRESLPLVHGHAPRGARSPTAEIDDQLARVVVEGVEYRLQAVHGELRVWEEV